MTWQLWIVLALLAFDALGNVLIVGEKREPLRPTQAASLMLVNVVMATLILTGA